MKKILLVISMLFIRCIITFAQPANDDCSGAISLGTLPTPPPCGNGIQNGANATLATTNVNATPEVPYVTLTGCGMASPANSVWYTFVVPPMGYGVVITVAGATFANPNIALWQGANCNVLSGFGCVVGAGGTATLNIGSGMVVGNNYYIQISGNTGQSGTFNLSVHAYQDCGNCLNAATLTVNPLPVNGTYQPGQVVSFCFHIDLYTQIGQNWLHGIQLTFGPGWSLPSLVTFPPPFLLDNAGTWAYYPAGVTSSANGTFWPAGFYFDDVDPGTNPGNNFGDGALGLAGIIITPGANDWNFCWNVTVLSGCNPGMSLVMTVNTSGDGESGSWTSAGCASDNSTSLSAMISCCPPNTVSTSTCTGLSNGTATANPVGVAGPYVYSWAPGGQATQTATGLAAGPYVVTVTDANLCVTTANVTVLADPVPTVNAVANFTPCAGDAVAVPAFTSALGGTTFAWTNSNPAIGLGASGNGNIPVFNAVNAGTLPVTATITVTPTSGPPALCVGTPITFTITVTPPPSVAAAGPNQTVCGTTATLAGNAVTVGTGTWTLVSGTGTITTPSSPTSGITGLGVGANVFQWTITNAPCPPSTSQVTITGGDPPSIASAGPDQTVCGTTCTMAGNAAAVGTGLWTLVSGAGIITTPASPVTGITGLGVGANVFQWTISNPPCPPTTSQVTITAGVAATVANAGPNQTICGTTATLAGNQALIGTGTWTLISGTGTITNPTLFNSGITGLGIGANVFQWEIDLLPCPPTNSQVTITAGVAATVANAGPNQTVCGAIATLAGNQALIGTGAWTLISGAGTITNSTLFNSGITGLGVGANVFEWTITNPPCPPTSSQVTITSVANPTVANAGPNQTVCGTTATLAGNQALIGTGTWTLVSGAGTITNPTLFNSGITGLGVGANVFQWTITNAPCPPSTSQVTITGGAPPTVSNAGLNQTICGTTCTMAGNAAAIGTGIWTLVSGAGTITTPTSEFTGITALGVGANVFQWTITNAPCPPSSSQVTITQVAPPTVAVAGPNQSICISNPSATLAANTPIVGTGQWTLISGTGTITNPTLFNSGITGLGVGANVFQWSITNPPCPVSTSQVTITGVPSPVITVNSPTICSGQAANLTANGGTSYLWSAGAAFTGVNTATASPVSSTTYTVTGTTSGCSSTAVSTVTVNPLPTAVVSGGGGVCTGNVPPPVLITFTGTGPWNLTYSCSGIITSVVSATSPFIINNPVAGTYTAISVSDANCTGTTSGSATITFYPLPSPSFTANPLSGCAPLCVTFTNTSSITSGTISSYVWNFGDGFTSMQQNPNYCYNNSGDYNVSLTAVSANGCSFSDTIINLIHVYPYPTALFTAPGTSSIYNPTVFFTDHSLGANSWTWDFGDVNSSSNTSIAQNPNHTYSAIGTYCVLLTVSNGFCIDTNEICVIIEPEFTFYIPNTVSPNGDGINDEFFGKGEGIKSYQMWIYDRWGNNVFYGDDIIAHWDGTFYNHTVQEDVYVYVIHLNDFRGEEHKYIGSVTVVR